MSFRKEIKSILNRRNSFDFKKMIIKKGAIEIYPKRKISSLYFDNAKKQTHVDSEEGALPRKKIRIRTYPNDENIRYYLEKKISINIKNSLILKINLRHSQMLTMLRMKLFTPKTNMQ